MVLGDTLKLGSPEFKEVTEWMEQGCPGVRARAQQQPPLPAPKFGRAEVSRVPSLAVQADPENPFVEREVEQGPVEERIPVDEKALVAPDAHVHDHLDTVLDRARQPLPGSPIAHNAPIAAEEHDDALDEISLLALLGLLLEANPAVEDGLDLSRERDLLALDERLGLELRGLLQYVAGMRLGRE